MDNFFANAIKMKEIFFKESFATLYMVLSSSIIAGTIGLFLGVILVCSKKDGILENKYINTILGILLSIFRAIPFIILLTLISPLTRILVKTTIGVNAAIVPLVFATVPFYARQIETAVSEVDKGLVEAAKAMGLSNVQIIFKVYLREARESIIRVSAITIISLIGLTTMAGAIGAGGIGKLAIDAYNRFQQDVIFVSTFIILILVFLVQISSQILIKTLKK